MPRFRFNPREEDYWDECPECFGTGLYTPRITAGDEYLHGEIVLDDPCEECFGTGKIELDYDEVMQRAVEEFERQEADYYEERYYHEKYGDE